MKKQNIKKEDKVKEIKEETSEPLPQTQLFKSYQRIIRGKKYVVQAVDLEHANQLLDEIENNIF